jgi:hypothetical protein
MERKKTILLGLLLFGFSFSSIHAQENTTVAGGVATGTGSMSYSIGQVFYKTYSSADGSSSEGVQQAYEISTAVSVDEFDEISLEMNIYPNPTSDFLTLDVKDFSFEEIDYILYDMNGKILEDKKVLDKKTIIDMMNLPPTIYFLKVSDGETVMKTFKIIKN